MTDENQIIEEFRRAMLMAGIEPGPRVSIKPTSPTEPPQRFHVDGDASYTRNGWYALFADFPPSGAFGCYKRGIQQRWTFDNGGRKYTPEELAEIERKHEATQKAAKEAERERHGEAAKAANLMLEAAEPADDEHPYLKRKGVPAHDGLRVGVWTKADKETGEIFLRVPNALLVPIIDTRGRIINVQAIFPEKHPKLGRDKDFMPGGKKRGGFFMIGRPKDGKPIALCEGYATGASVHAATGLCVVVTFDAGNLFAVAQSLRESAAFDGRDFVVCGDNDAWTKEPIDNPGKHWAERTGKAINCRVVLPTFEAHQLESKPTDWNDLHALAGLTAVALQITPPPPTVKAEITSHAGVAGAVVTKEQDDDAATDPACVDRFSLPDVGGKGAVLPTHGNLREICRRLGVVLRYNLMTKDQEIIIPRASFSMDNAQIASFAWLENECVLFRMPTEKLKNSLSYLCDQNQYSPVVQWVSSRPWDGVSRLREFFDTVTPAGTKGVEVTEAITRKLWLRDQLIMRWMLSAIAAAYSPEGVEAGGMLVFQGMQYVGKTRWVMSLTPKHLRLAKEGVTLDPKDKDSVKVALSSWLVELGELDATFRKSDIAALKAFITRGTDTLRLPYMPKENTFARRTVYFGSVNPKQFLHDPTGNRRYYTIEVEAIDHVHAHIDMQQVWAEFLALWQGGEQYHLTDEEMQALNGANEEFSITDPIEERIQTRLDWSAMPEDWRWCTATDVLVAVGVDRPTGADCSKAAAAIRKLNGDRGKRSNGRSVLLVPPPIRSPLQ